MAEYIYTNDVQVGLLRSANDTDTSIYVLTAEGIYNNPPEPVTPQIGVLKLVNRIDNPNRNEVITYTGCTAVTGGYQLTGVTRGQGGTSALQWEASCFGVGVLIGNFVSGVYADAQSYNNDFLFMGG